MCTWSSLIVLHPRDSIKDVRRRGGNVLAEPRYMLNHHSVMYIYIYIATGVVTHDVFATISLADIMGLCTLSKARILGARAISLAVKHTKYFACFLQRTRCSDPKAMASCIH